MRNEWQEMTLADAPVEIIDGDRGVNYPKQGEFSSIGHCLFLNTGNVTINGFNFESCQFISEDKDKILRKGKLRRDDVVLTTRGTVGNLAYYKNSIPFEHIRINSGMVIFRADANLLLPAFLYQFLRSQLFADQVSALRSGSAQPQLPIRDINRITTPIPPLPVQQRIADVLGKLDDKIELNRRMNRTLEKIAATIFKSWFIDFDPVHAKAEGRDPGLPAEIADLFPDNFQDSELGPIPAGWSVKPLDQIANYLNGLACQKHPPLEGQTSLPVIKIKELRQGITNSSDRASISVPREYIVEDGDILFSWSGSLLVTAWCGGRGVLNQHVFKVASPTYPKWFFYQATKQHLGEFQQIASDKATTMGHIKRHHLAVAKMAIPEPQLIEAGTEILGRILDRRINAMKQAQALAVTRNTLLPRLLNGQIVLSK